MVPPGDLFGVIPIWLAVYALTAAAFSASGFILYRRVFRPVVIGKNPNRFDRPLERLLGAVPLIFGQRKVLQSVSLKDRAGLAHFFIFWGFLSFTASYVLFRLTSDYERIAHYSDYTEQVRKILDRAPFITRALGLIQSLLSLGLIALFILALRRRFRMA